MWKNILYYFIIIKLFHIILSDDDVSYILSNSGAKGVAVTSFSNELYLISSNQIYNIINQNFHSIKTNLNDNINTRIQFYKNFEILEASINLNTNESVFLIAENRGNGGMVNLYSLNVSSEINENNPKLIYNKISQFGDSRISLINTGTDKYLLSYIINQYNFENIWFKYTAYEGFEILKTFNIIIDGDNTDSIDTKITTGMSCFLLYEQFPICFYSTRKNTTTTTSTSTSTTIKYSLNVVVMDIIFNSAFYDRFDSYIFTLVDNLDIIYYSKAIYLSNDYAVFCYMDQTKKLICLIKQLNLDFITLGLSSTDFSSQYTKTGCNSDINEIDVIKIGENKFLVGCVNSNNNPSIDLITVDNSFSSISTTQLTTIQVNIKSTLTLFVHELTLDSNYYGFIYDDSGDNKIKYVYLNLPYCSLKDEENKPFLEVKFTIPNPNVFKLSDYLESKIENNKYSTNPFNIQSYKIISFYAVDGDKNVFNYEIKKSDTTNLNTNDIISKDDQLTITPLISDVFNSGKFYIRVAPINNDLNVPGKSCIFEFDTICYEGCSTCNKYEEDHTDTTKHNCISCKSNYYSMGDLCLRECSLIQGYHNVYLTKTCLVNELEVSNDCKYIIWSIDQTEEINSCYNTSFCPKETPYIYNITGECVEFCRYSELKNGECIINNIKKNGVSATNYFLDIIVNEITQLGDDIFEYNEINKINRSIVVNGTNITVEITDTFRIKQYINNNIYVSQIMNISECESILRENNPTISEDQELIILKIDLRRNDTASTQIEYKIYDPTSNNIRALDLSSCNNIIFKVPLWLTDEYKNKIIELNNKKINIFDIKEKFYSDLCHPYHATEFDADLTIQKRQKVYYYYNANLCEKSCQYDSIDLTTFQVVCICPKKTDINLDMSSQDLFEYVEEKDQVIVYKETISNLKSVTCFKYVFTEVGFTKNWGSYFMMLMIVGFIITMILWFKTGQDDILNRLRNILDIILIKLDMFRDDKFRKKYEELKAKFKEEPLEEDKVENIDNENNMNNINNNNVKENGNVSINVNNIEESIHIIENKENNNSNEKEFITNLDNNLKNDIEIVRKKGPKTNILLYRSIVLNKENDKIEKKNPKKKKKYEHLTDIELDLLLYEKAIEMDERTYCGYYWSQLKLRQLIIFTFFSYDDFNFFLIKLISFFLLLSLNLVYNTIFFFDKIIDEIYDDRGKYSLKLQILNIFISSIIFSLTIILIRFIITCHKKFIKLKNMDKYDEAQKESFAIHKSLIFRYMIYIIIGIILLLIFWYFITCFCAIFIYTQNHLFLNAFISFCFSMIYPFIYCLLPALFRYLALNKNHNKLYCFSQYI